MRRFWKKAFGRTQLLGFVPVLTLGAYWAGGEAALLGVALVLPLLLATMGGIKEQPLVTADRDPLTGLVMRDGLMAWAEVAIRENPNENKQVAVISLTIDDMETLVDRFGGSMRDTILRDAAERLKPFVREKDVLARTHNGFAIGIRNAPSQENETLLVMAERLQSTFDEPFNEGPTRTFCSLSVGIAGENHVKAANGANLMVGAQTASEYAAVSSPGTVRFYSEGMSSERILDRDIAHELAGAMEAGEIVAWFQPQTDIRTGKVTGFEALARWDHPERGMISPAVFLPDIEACGLSQRLAEVILKQSLMALNTWDAAGFDVETVSVNFSSEELRNPRLPDYIRWELDRHDLAPDRLIVEVLETVAAESNEDSVTRTLTTLSKIGCGIDLDDFGTGFTSFANIRRFDVGRIKIDRSLVSQVDRDETQEKMIAALLAFSEKLGIEVLAEGVETEEEVETLSQLGCNHAQGFVISRPMPLGDTLNWLDEVGAVPAQSARRSSRSA